MANEYGGSLVLAICCVFEPDIFFSGGATPGRASLAERSTALVQALASPCP